MFGANYAPILCHDLQYLEMNQNELPREPHHLAVPFGESKMILEPKYVWLKPCTYLAPTLTPSPNGPKQDST
jgi:hypothetical protein